MEREIFQYYIIKVVLFDPDKEQRPDLPLPAHRQQQLTPIERERERERFRDRW